MAFRYKFDDERVTKEDIKRALEEQYGGEEEVIYLTAAPLLFLLFVLIVFANVLLAGDG